MLNLRCGFLRAMRGLIGTYALVAAVSASAQVPPVPEVLYYRFNESGTTLTNYASSPPAGTATASIIGSTFTQANAFTATANSLAGTGAAASTDYVNTNWATSLTGSWTLSFFTSNIVPSSTLWYILGDATAGSFRCFTNGVAGPNNWILRGPITDVLISGAADANQHMVTFVYDSVNNEIRGYKDAVQVTTVSQTPGLSFSRAGPFKVGGYGTNFTLNGNMADFRLYSRALTATEISDVYNYVEKSYFVGGMVTGLTAAGLVLQNNSGDALPIAADGSFQFATPLVDASNYDVTVSAQPAGQDCVVTNGSGTLAGASVTNVAVDCSDTPTALVITVDDGSSYAQYGQPIDYLVTLTNNGGTTASGVTVSSAATGLDAANAKWSCTPGGGATCSDKGLGTFGDTVTVPFNGTLSWVVTIAPLSTADTAEFDVSAPGTSASDTDTLVVFRDGFGD